MKITRRSGARRNAGQAAAVVLLFAGVTLCGVAPSSADDGPSVPPGTQASAEPPVAVDPADPDLKMPEGGTLAPGRVLDIVQVVEDLGGEERREDSNADIKFALQAEVLFGKDSAKLGAAANARIAAIADEIKKQKATKVRVFGFTDNLGSSAHGDVLSKQRADAVHGVLSKLLGPTITYEIRGYGEQYPIASNSNEEGRKKNRRVEVSFPRGEGS
ncbi:OmpA family protein [Streptomyces sp. SID8374]|uniref:OmpA family protein n=1 Tax=unclassified Streptomyces TaxID=2593676 RepID=UPI00081E09A3|nr:MULTISPECIES: OmpA family protein [unclassified Streptomyces]MYR95304.1 OmpA family protein [Streptomyces sp. SID4937]MYX16204.1 OmpA family protein [Streptomyces sp. SID8374]SCD87415.1 Outer membrane protein OmpA [Streptomyces sp. ScaeMP-e83]